MANKNIKGITIKIGAETTELTKALKNVDSIVAKSNSELKNLNQALKLDPKNTELLAQKQEVLAKNINATKERLEALKEAQKQMGDYATLTDEQKESYRALSVEIAKSESALKGMNKELTATNNVKVDKLQEGLKKVGEIALDVSKKMLEISAAVGGALAGIVAAGIKSFGEYEQQVGGIEAMFDKTTEEGKRAFDEISQTGKNAWKDLTMSTTDYYKTFTSTYTLVKNSIPDQEKAIQTTNQMIKLESDLSNTFGYDISTASNAINWALKGSFNYIDNLNLGIKGTKEGFLDAAQSCGYMVNSVDELTSDEILDVLTQYANKFGVIDRTANEASGTIQGSVKSMKAAFDNFLNGSGGADELINALRSVLINVATAFQDLAPEIIQGLQVTIQYILPLLVDIIYEILPTIIDAVSGLIKNLLNYITEHTEEISKAVTDIATQIVEFVSDNLPLIIEAALIIILCLADGLIDALPKLIEVLPTLIEQIVNKLTEPDMLAKLIAVSLKLIITLALGISKAIPELIKIVPNVLNNFRDELIKKIQKTDWGKLGSDIIKGICDGFGKIGNYITQKVNQVKDQITSKFKSIFGIHSPSTLMRDTIGLNITAGIGEGIEEGIPQALRDVDAAMKQLNAGIEASVNPTINPSMTYESNYNMMALAMKEALKDMDVVLDDDRVGKFVVKTITEEVYS